jgi:SAM-dependent methyltransferase
MAGYRPPVQRAVSDTAFGSARLLTLGVVLRSVATRGVTERLRQFVSEAPYERQPIFEFVGAAADATAAGARVLDVGAGSAPYRELFQHTDYTTADWEQSVHVDGSPPDVTAPADGLRIEDCSFDVVINTQVLEHVPEPGRVLSELYRVLVDGGRLFLTAPLVGELHELPHDYYRYTSAGLTHLLEQAGFADVEIKPRNDCFSTIAQLLLNVRWAMGRQADGLDARREETSALLEQLAEQVARLAPLDTRWELPLGFTASALRPRRA